jgi:hypothetical protein
MRTLTSVALPKRLMATLPPTSWSTFLTSGMEIRLYGKVFKKLAMMTTSAPARLLVTAEEPSARTIATSPPIIAWNPSDPPGVRINCGSNPCFLNIPASLAMISAA